MQGLGAGIVNVMIALVGLAALAAIVGARSRTTEVITATGNAFNGAIGAALEPVNGSGLSLVPGLGHP